MKVKRLKFKNHKVLGDLDISFQIDSNNTLDTIVFIGENGTGKTTILREIYNLMDLENMQNSGNKIFLELEENEKAILKKYPLEKNNNIIMEEDILYDCIDIKKEVYDFEDIEKDKYKSKVIYLPTEVNFNSLKSVDRTFRYKYKFRNEINENLISDLPSAIANKIYVEMIMNEDLPARESKEKVCKEVNSVFESMDLDIEFVGLSKDENTVPIFRNIEGKEFDINGLSSGEKQLFLRALSLKFLNVNNSIILIDEPEISLHPRWQRKIVNVYENIGENNQIIIATHSPHIIGNVKKEQLRVLKKDKEGIKVMNSDELDETYGKTVESILMEVMGIINTRNEETAEKIEELRDLVREDKYGSKEFEELYKSLRKYLGNLDIDLNLIDMEVKRRINKKEKIERRGSCC
ncbi:MULTISPECIES: AAA family ATPase [Peptacetobacter]|uniref:AAA family ATPase n=1 Tax=Peptacetobacter TaxID=2743582 RepID=UPI001916D287|nr:ATP-binding protein [Peptacetobacter hiranonis]MEE0247616.1 AAA family ATPase [Peptacetobacter hiranonis]QQQ86237.1 AAA family ATPase [Peptacetobacter hiranonis]